MQLLGTVLGGALIAFLLYRPHAPAAGGVLWGAAIAIVWMLGRAVWRLEKKAQRSQNALIEVDEDGLQLTDSTGNTSVVPWDEIEDYNVIGGRLTLSWKAGQFAVGTREIENGMTLIREVQRFRQQHDPTTQNGFPSNFIPLEPK